MMANMSHANITLEDVNEERAILLIPAMLYIGFMMLLGIPGNTLVVYVFTAKLKTGTQNILIVALAVFDLLTCFIAMPTEIADLRFFYTSVSQFSCKMFRFVETFTAICSIFTLVCIAIDRYRKICLPLKTQLSVRQVKMCVGGVVVLSLVITWPQLVLNGIMDTETPVEGVIGRDCSTRGGVKNSLYPRIFNGLLAFIFISLAITLCVLYAFIMRQAKKHAKYKLNSGSSKPSDQESSADNTGNSSSAKRNSSVTSPRRRTNKTTKIAFLVTIVFILSFLPYLTLWFIRSIMKTFDKDLRGAGVVFFNMFLRSYFVNSAANPIIYGVMNLKFRAESVRIIKRICCCRKN